MTTADQSNPSTMGFLPYRGPENGRVSDSIVKRKCTRTENWRGWYFCMKSGLSAKILAKTLQIGEKKRRL